MKKLKLFIDMDDTIAKFIGDERLNFVPLVPKHTDYPEMHKEGFFLNQKPINGALDAVNKIIDSDQYEVYILSVPLYSSPHSYSEKVIWIQKHFPKLSGKIILTQDKGLILGDILIDDSMGWKAPWEANGGIFIHMNPRLDTVDQWTAICQRLLK